MMAFFRAANVENHLAVKRENVINRQSERIKRAKAGMKCISNY
jgi:hypothetical protein